MLRKLGVYSLVLGGIVLAVVVSYKYLVLGQTDLGFRYDYAYCRNGVFTTQPKGVDKGEVTYYKSEAKRVLLARCLPDDATAHRGGADDGATATEEPKPPINCREMKEVAGECKKFSIWSGAGR